MEKIYMIFVTGLNAILLGGKIYVYQLVMVLDHYFMN